MKSSFDLGERLQKIISTVELNLSLISKSPNQRVIHDFRTSFRRLQAARECLPRSLRNKTKMHRYFSTRKEVFKKTTAVRDLDIIAEKLAKCTKGFDIQDLISLIRTARERKLSTISHLAKIRFNTPPPRLNSTSIDATKVLRHVTKITTKLDSRLPLQASSSNAKEIHQFRKYVKKIRYSREFVALKNSSELDRTLRIWQTQLGNIRDAQITQEFLRKRRDRRDFSEIMKREKKLEAETYEAFDQGIKSFKR